jgi:LmbE family N-acetylglucosaminyl deacetylase
MRILAIGAHLDDLEVACGGTLAVAARRGHAVRMLVLSRSGYANARGEVLRTEDQALAEGKAAARALGVDDLRVLGFPTKDVPATGASVEAIARELETFQPTLVLTHHRYDSHQAHVGTAQATFAAARRQPALWMYEGMQPSGRPLVPFKADVYVDIGDALPAKVAALKAHASQYAKYGEAWVETLSARARCRGFEAGVRYAEAFEVIRMPLAI